MRSSTQARTYPARPAHGSPELAALARDARATIGMTLLTVTR